MGNFLYLVTIVMIVLWAIGFFAYNVGAIIHILLLLALIAFLVRVMTGNENINKYK